MLNSKKTSLVSFIILLWITGSITLWLAHPFLLSITMGGIISLMVRPLYLILIKNKIGPKLSSLTLTIGIVLIIILPLTLLSIVAVKQGITIGHAISENKNFPSHSLLTKINKWPPVNFFFDDVGVFELKAKEWIDSIYTAITNGIMGFFSQIPSIIIQLLIAAISCFVFLLDGEKFASWMSDKIPLEFDVRKKLSASFIDTAVSTIWATLAAGAAQTVVILIAFITLGVPAPILAGGLTFIFAWIPMVGCSPVWGVAAIYLISQGMMDKAIFMVIFGLSAGIIDNIVRPMTLKGRSKIHPMVSLISIFGGIAMFGIVGVFIGPVLASLMISLLKLWSEIGARHGLLPASLKPKSKSNINLESVGIQDIPNKELKSRHHDHFQ